MKKITPVNIVLIAAILALAFSCVSMEGQIKALKNELETVSSMYNQLDNRYGSLYSYINEKFDEQTKLTDSVSYEYQQYDLETHSVKLAVNLSLREVRHDASVYVSLSDERVEAKKSGEIYTAVCSMPIDARDLQVKLLITDSEKTLTQSLDIGSFADDCIPGLSGYYDENVSSNSGKLVFSGNIELNGWSKDENYGFDLASLRYSIENAKSGEVLKTAKFASTTQDGKVFNLHEPLQAEVVTNDSNAIRLYALVEDSLGLTHKLLLFAINSSDAVDIGSCTILDSAGNALFEVYN